MSTAPTNRTPPEPNIDERPNLQAVPDPPAETETAAQPDTEVEVEPDGDVLDADDGEDDGDDEPVLDTNGDPVTPQAPWDVQLTEAAVRYLHGIPAFGQRPASFAEAIEYSQNGDWATNTNGAKRAAHGIATVIAFVVTWPLVDLLGKARTKPGPFCVALFIAFAVLNIAVFAL